MSKRAKEKALELFPIDMQMCIDNKGKPYEADVNEHRRKYVAFGYEQAEKDTTDRAAKWIREHWREYIWGPDADGCIGFGLWENDFRKAMED